MASCLVGFCNNRGFPRLFSTKRLSLGKPLYGTVDLLASDGHSLRCIVPSVVSIPRKRVQLIQVWNAETTESNIKKANLFARRSERIQLPIYTDSIGTPQPINRFLSHPLGMESILNTREFQHFEYLGPNTYRCTLQKIEFLNFEVAPTLDLRVTTTSEECIVEMLSCRIEGSRVLESQNKRFSASAKNHIMWDTNCKEPYLDVNVELNVILEIYTLPFSLLPISAVEGPGTIIMQTLVDRLVPLFLEQLLKDYRNWAQMDRIDSERVLSFSSMKSDVELHHPKD